jgi:NADPH:quinone reductase
MCLICVLALGAKVIAAAGSQVKLNAVKKYAGADHLIDYTKPGWQKEVLKITSGHGVDVVYDPVGLIQGLSSCCFLSRWQRLTHASPTDCLKCIAWKGRAVVVGFAGGKIEKVLVPPSSLTWCSTFRSSH